MAEKATIKVISIDSLAQGIGIPKALELQIGALFGKCAGDDPDYLLRVAVCGACVLEVERIGQSYLAKFPNDGGGALYWPNAALGDIILAHCKCGNYQ